MARRRSDDKQPSGGGERPKLTPFEIFRLILRTYAASLPYIVIFVAVMLVATWVFTTLVFR